ncbi:MAG: hypothetical protein ABL958_13290 [Bdellovibrionia bacterium]
MSHTLDPEIQSFIDKFIDSVEQLEILVLLKESAPKSWSDREINEKLQSNLGSVRERLAGLCKLDLIKSVNNLFVYPGSNDKYDQIIEMTSHAYKRSRIRIIEMIFSRPKNKLRDFSDAFKIRKGKKDG